MGKNLLIVESPSKSRTIRSYLGDEFLVLASVGHIKDLPKNQLGVDIEKNFQPEYEIIKGKEKIIKQLRQEGSKAEAIYLGPDPDREGEAIAWHIKEELQGQKKPIYRVLFNEVTKKAILDAISNPRTLDKAKYESQQARRILDRLVGYLISPLLWQKVKGGLSAGRVQSVALRMICEREREIFAFVSKEYWSLTATLQGPEPQSFQARLVKYKGEKLERPEKQVVDEVFEHVQQRPFRVEKVERKKVKRSAPLPFITSTLQQEAFKSLGFSAKKTMRIAQQLYEGIDLKDKGMVGLITYMRTDSTRLSNEAITLARAFVEKVFGKDYVAPKPYTYRSKGPIQDAHEAIRPTHVELTPEEVADSLTKEQLALYTLVWKRFLASQMAPAILEQTGIEITAGDAIFKASGSTVVFKGFMELYMEEEGAEEGEGELLPKVDKGELLTLLELKKEQHFTQPPSRYTEATLIKALEENGIGRPSTYATIIANILERKYVEKVKKHLKPTEMGFLVNDLLVKGFPKIMDVKFTARMEEDLDRIEKGETSWLDVIRGFYETFQKDLSSAQKELKAEVMTEIPCPLCGAKMVIRSGKNGLFLGCSKFPECKGTANFTRDASGNIQVLEKEDQITEKKCPKCGNPLIKRIGRFGSFLACSSYPKCKYTESIDGQEGVFKCPREGCDGHLVPKRTRKGKVFYGCSRYPDCDYVTWQKPKAQ